MYTQCPECLSVFSLGAYTLAQAHAFVTCGYCGADFDSLATLADELPAEPFNAMALNEPSLTPPRVQTVVYQPLPATDAVGVDASALDAPTAVEDFSQLVFAPRFARAPAPKVARKKHRQRRPAAAHSLAWALSCGALTLLLCAQLAWASRDLLLSTPLSGAWLRAGCATLHCTLPLVAAPDRLRLLDSNVQTHPSAPHALMISVLQRGLPAGGNVVLLLEVVDPGDQAVAFEFAFE